jgi:hypothetical protein
LPGLFLLGGGLLQSVHDLLVDAYPGGVVMAAGGGGVDADQGQVCLPLAGGFGGQTLQKRAEDTGVPPDPEASVDGGPGPEFARHLTPLGTGPEPPDHPPELVPQPLGVRTVLAGRQIRLDQLPLLMGELPARHNPCSYRIRTPGGSGSEKLITTSHRP